MSSVEKKNSKLRVFRNVWLEVEGFKNWLEPINTDSSRAYCKICQTELSARFYVLKEHAKSQVHCKFSKVYPPFPDDFFKIKDVGNEYKEKIAEAELKFVGMCTQLNIPFISMPKLLKSIQHIDDANENSIFHKMRVGATKARNLVVNIIGNEQQTCLRDILYNTSFGVCLYKSTDLKDKDCFSIVIRFCNLDTGEIETKLWDQIQMGQVSRDTMSTSDKLFKFFDRSFSISDVPLQNILLICYDGCKTQLDDMSQLKTKLIAALPDTISLECPIYRMCLCLQHAINQLPNDIHCFIVNVNSMLNNLKDFDNITVDLNYKTTAIFNIDISSLNRTLTFGACLNRIIEQWTVILNLAQKQALHNDTIAKEIIDMISKFDTKCYILLVQQIVSEINSLTKTFQTEKVILHKMKELMDKTYRNIASMVLNRDYVLQAPISEMIISDNPNRLMDEDFEICEEIKFCLKSHAEDMKNFCRNYYNFIVTLITEIRTKFYNLNNSLYEAIKCLCPENAISQTYRELNSDIFTILLELFPKLIKNKEHRKKISEEWMELSSLKMTTEKLAEFPEIENFWYFVYNFVEDGVCKYVNVGSFALNVLCTPHANMKIEQTPNTHNILKSKSKKNNMYDSTINATLRAQQVVKSRGGITFQPTSQMIKKAGACQYYNNT